MAIWQLHILINTVVPKTAATDIYFQWQFGKIATQIWQFAIFGVKTQKNLAIGAKNLIIGGQTGGGEYSWIIGNEPIRGQIK